MKKIVGALMLCFSLLQANAQLTPDNQMFLFNPVLVNPAMAGMHDGQIQLGYDARWVGLKGAPNTAFLRYDKQYNGNTGWDIAVISDRIGPVSTYALVNSFSYSIQTTSETRLSFGIKHHISQSYLNLSSSQLIDPTDPLLAVNQTGIPVNNFDAGVAFYNSNMFMVGFSFQNMIHQPVFRFTNNYQVPVFSLHGWYAYDVSDEIGIEAFALFTSTNNTPMNINIGCMGVLQHKIGAGLNFSPGNQLGLFAYVKATDKLNIFYNYNLPLSSIYKVSKQSHSIGISYRVGKDAPIAERFLMMQTSEGGKNRMF